MGRFITHPLSPGDIVAYVPAEANGDPKSHHVEFGIVVSQDYPYALVRMYNDAKAAGTFNIDARKYHADRLIKLEVDPAATQTNISRWV